MADRNQIIEDNAAWAERFRNTPTNAVTRMRRAADIAAAEDQEAIRDAAQFERRLEVDSGARALFLGRERLAQGQQRLGLAERKFADQQIRADATQERLLDRDTFDRQIRTNKAELDALNTERMMRKDLRDTENAKRILDQTIKAERDIDDKIFGGVLPGTKEFADIALRTIARFPMMDPKARQSILSSAKILGDDEEFDTAWGKLTPEQRARATVTDDPKGWRISVGPEKQPKPAEDQGPELRKRMMDLIKMDTKNLSEEDKMFVESEKRQLRKAMADLSAPPQSTGEGAPPAVKERTATNPTTGEKFVLRGGKWEPVQ